MTYFKNTNTLEELRKQYKELLKRYHPDNPNGSTEATQQINQEYEKLFKLLKDKHDSRQTSNTEKKTSFYNNMKYDFSEDIKLREVLNKVINFTDVTIGLCGSWIWISGNTYQYKKELREIGFKWAPNKKAWYWHSEAFRKRSNKKLSMNDIRNYYGSTEVQPEQRMYIEA